MQLLIFLVTIILGISIPQGYTRSLLAETNDISSEEDPSSEEEKEGAFGPEVGQPNPDEIDNDMILVKEQIEFQKEMAKNPGGQQFRNVIHKNYWRSYLWTEGKIPYIFQDTGDNSVDDYTRNVTLEAMKWLNEESAIFGKPCLKFVPKTDVSERNYIIFETRFGCYSHVGMTRGSQLISLGPGCAKKGVVAHELLHALGFYHEQSRTDRNDYVTVNWNNIRQHQEFNFEQTKTEYITDKAMTRYDFDSIMHYSSYAFSKANYLKTIEAKPGMLPRGVLMGQRSHLSVTDLKEIREVYSCTGPKGETFEDNSKRQTGGSDNSKKSGEKSSGKTKMETKDKGGSQTKKGKNKSTAQSRSKEDNENFELNCDFENSSPCEFSKDSSSDFSWTRSSGGTETPNTGPSSDHTKGNKKGNYYYAEASGHSGEVGGILSPKIPPGSYCLDFWFHMYGSDVGDFKVFVDEQGKKERTKVWRESRNQGDEWNNQKVSISAEKPFMVAFVAEMKKNGDEGDIAIDDVMLTKGACK